MQRSCRVIAVLVAGCVVAGCESGSPGMTAPGGTSASQVRTLVDVTTGLEVTGGGTGTWNWAGQSFTVPGSGAFNNVRFNFYTFQRTATAFGTLYLLDREYLGVPGDLVPSTPGYLGRAAADNTAGSYTFAASVTLNAGTRYWVYTDTQGSFAGSFDQDIYPLGDMYVTGYRTNPFRKAPASGRMVNGVLVPAPSGVFVDANFKLQASAR